MASTLSAMRADPLFESGVAPTVAKDAVAGFEDALTRLAHQAASDMPDARAHGPASDSSADARISQSFAAATAPTLSPLELGPADLSAQFPREPRSLGARRTVARIAIVVCLGAVAIWAWRAHGGPARDMLATWTAPFSWISARPVADQTSAPKMPDPAPEQAAAPAAVKTSAPSQAASQAPSIAQPATTAANAPAAASADRQQNETMARDLAVLRQTVERLAAGQERLTRELAKLQAEKPQVDRAQADKPPAEKPAKRVQRPLSAPGGSADVFDPAQNPTAPGVPHALGYIVVPRASPR